MSNLNKLVFILCLAWGVSPLSVDAARIFAEVTNSVETNKDFVVDVIMDTRGEFVNAVEGEVVFDEGVLQVLDFSDGNSSLNFWVTQPRVEDGRITFSGITPGGFSGERKKLFSISLRPLVKAKTEISMKSISVLKNDGLATKAEVEFVPLLLELDKSVNTVLMEEGDQNPPESFLPFVVADQEIFDGKYFLVFSAQDKGVGIKEYLVKEGLFGTYIPADSPYLLPNQDLDKKIYVRAVDKNGNDRVATLKPENYKDWYKDPLVLGIIVLLIVFPYLKKRWSRRSNFLQ